MQLQYDERSVSLVLLDDGRGFDLMPAAGQENGHYGLTMMRERADQIGATLAISNRPSGGTQVELSVPLNTAHARSHVGHL